MSYKNRLWRKQKTHRSCRKSLYRGRCEGGSFSWPQVTARPWQRLKGDSSVHNYFMIFMENHLPENEYTMATNTDGKAVPRILFNGTCYELELITASDVGDLVKALGLESGEKVQ